MALNIQPFQFQYQPIQARTPQPQAPVWGPPDMSKQLQEGIAGILPSLAKSYQNVNQQFQNEAAGRAWMSEAERARTLGQPGGPYAPATVPTGPTGPTGPYNPAGKLPTFAGGDQGTKTTPAAPEVAASVQKYAAQYGLDPKDVLTAMSYETGGTLNPWQKGPTTKWGEHRGLIQWGEPQRQQYGITKDSSIDDQVQATMRYLHDRGVRPGMGLMDIYSAINAGGVGPQYQGRSDAAAGGAPGTVADKVNTQMAGHMRRAEGLLRTSGDQQPVPGETSGGGGAYVVRQGQPPAAATIPPAGQPTQQQLDNWRAIVANPRSPPPMLDDAKANLAKFAPGTAAAPVGQPQAAAAVKPGVVTQTPPAQYQVAGGQQQPPLFQAKAAAYAAGVPGISPDQEWGGANDPALRGGPRPPPGPPQTPAAAFTAANMPRDQTWGGANDAGPPVPPQNGPGPVALPGAPPSLVGAPPPQIGGQPPPAAPPPATPPPPPPAAPPPAAPPAAAPPQPIAAPPALSAPAVQAANRLGLQPEQVAGMTPGMMKALGHAMMANDPQMVAAITGGINAVTAAKGAQTGDWTVEHDGRGNWVRANKRTGEVQPLNMPGQQQPQADVIVQPGDEAGRAKYGLPKDTRPWKVSVDKDGIVKKEPLSVNPATEQENTIAQGLEKNDTFRDFRKMHDAVTSMDASLKEGTAAGDLNATIQVFKAIDPGSTVTQNEAGQIVASGGLSGFTQYWANKITQNGGVMTPKMRADFFNAANEQLKARWDKQSSRIYEGARNKAKLIGADPDAATNYYEPPKFDERRTEKDYTGGKGATGNESPDYKGFGTKEQPFEYPYKEDGTPDIERLKSYKPGTFFKRKNGEIKPI